MARKARPFSTGRHRSIRLGGKAGLFCLAAFLVLFTTSCDEAPKPEDTAAKARPVTVLRLEQRDFSRETRLTGSVGLYREEQIGFEVSGRLLAVLDLGKEVVGPAFDETGLLVQAGDVIASLDDTRYRLRVQALEARVHSQIKELEAQRIEVEQVAEANLRRAQARFKVVENEVNAAQRDLEAADAELIRAEKELARQKGLLTGSAGRQKAVDDAQAAFDTAVARKAQREAILQGQRHSLDEQSAVVDGARANIALRNAQLESIEAKIAETEEELKRAQEDLTDTTLLAPYSGRVTAIHASQGAVIDAGLPVVTLSLMDPIQVRVEVSADDERRIRTGDRASIFPKDPVDPRGEAIEVNVIVYEKGAVADPGTRTFRIDLMARNERRHIDELYPETKGLPVVTDFLPVVRRYLGEGDKLYVPTDAVYHEDGKDYVLRLPGVSFSPDAERSATGRHLPEKIEVTLGDEYLTVIKWNFRILTDPGDLREGDFLVIGPRPEHLAGLAIGHPQWLLRPGDLIPVRFLLDTTPLGYYVPVDAITLVGDKHVVFAAADGMARQIDVTVHDTYGELRRIEGTDLRPGLRIIVGGVHYVSPGQAVAVVGEESPTP